MSDECHVCDELDAELMETKNFLYKARNHLENAASIIELEGIADQDEIARADFIAEIDEFLTQGETK